MIGFSDVAESPETNFSTGEALATDERHTTTTHDAKTYKDDKIKCTA